VKTDLTTTSAYNQSKALAGANAPKDLASKAVATQLPLNPTPDYQVELSSKPSPITAPAVAVPSVPTPDLPTPDFKIDLAKDKIKEAAKDEATKKASEITKVKAKNGSVKEPAIFFIKGLDIFSSPLKSEGGYAGMGRIADAIEGARVFKWNEKTEILEAIKETHKDYPVILVGHSLGGDTALEVADTLDSLEENFRTVDLLITLDAIGFSNDIIPQNVKNHLNVFGENNLFLNGGPHVARREDKSEVRNILSPLDHTDIDDDREIQYEVVSLIQKTLGEMKA
jgi:hypothetical protein